MWTTAAALAGLLVSSRPAAAVEWGLRAAVSAGATDNSLGAPEGQPGAESDAFVRSTVGLNLDYLGRRFRQALGYTFGASTFFARSERMTLSHELGWSTETMLTEFQRLGFTLGASQGRTSDLDLFARQEAGRSVARPTGGESFFAANAGQHYGWDFYPSWTFGQSINVSTYVPLEGSSRGTGFSGEVGANLSKNWTQDGVQLSGRVGQGRTLEVREMGRITMRSRYASFVQAGLGWNHKFNPDWGMNLGGGLYTVWIPERREPLHGPAFNGSLSYITPTLGQASLSGSRSVQSNVFVQDVFVVEGGSLRFDQPFGSDEVFVASGAIDYQRSRSVFAVISGEGKYDVWSGRVGFAYDTGRMWRISFEASYAYQDMFVMAAPGRQGGQFTYHRLLLAGTLEGRYPAYPSRLEMERRRERLRERGARVEVPAEPAEPGASEAP